MFGFFKRQVAQVVGTQEPIYGPEAIEPVAVRALTVPYTEVKKEDHKWAALNSTSIETQTFYFEGANEHKGMVQAIYSNISWPTFQFNTKIFYPGEEDKPIVWSSNQVLNFAFDSDKYSVFGDGLSISLSDDWSSYTIKSAVNENTLVDLEVTRAAPGFLVGNNGTTYFGTDCQNPWGSMRHLFWPRCTVKGGIITPDERIDFSGRGLFVHALQGMKPHHIAAKWNFVNFQSPTYSAVMMEYTTPPSYDSTVVNVGGIAKDGEIIIAGASGTAAHTKTTVDEETEWPKPQVVEYKWNGETKDGKGVSAMLCGPVGRLKDRIDVMAEIPAVLKAIAVTAVGTRPYIYQYAPDLPLILEIGEEKIEETGALLVEATFIS